jgi:tight adherence protein B
MKAGEFAALIVLCAIAGGVLGALLLGNIIFVLLIAAGASVIPYIWLVRARKKRQKKMGEQLPDVLSILASSLRAGAQLPPGSRPGGRRDQRPVGQRVPSGGVGDPTGSVDRRRDGRDGRPRRQRGHAVGRHGREHPEAGGGKPGGGARHRRQHRRERAYVQRQVRVLSAEGRLSIGILSALPFGIFFYLAFMNPEYVSPLFTTMLGRILLLVGGALMAAGIFVMTRIVRIDV